MLGLSIDKIVVLLIVAVFVVGPERMPKYAAQLARLVRSLRSMAEGAKDRLRDEMGPDFDDVDWKKLDPRQYDPRRIIRSALLDDPPAEAEPIAVVGLVKPVNAAPQSENSPADPAVLQSAVRQPLEVRPPDSELEPDYEPQVDARPVDAVSNAFKIMGS